MHCLFYIFTLHKYKNMKKLFLPLLIALILTSCSVSKPYAHKQPCYTIDTVEVVDMNGRVVDNRYVPHLVKHKTNPGTFAIGMFTGIVTFAFLLIASK